MTLTLSSFANTAHEASARLENHTQSSKTAIERLSSGQRLNKASDDAANISISARLAVGITEFEQASRNAASLSDLLGVADAALSEVETAIQRLRELGLAYQNATYNDRDRNSILDEASAITSHVSAVITETSWGGAPIFSETSGEKTVNLGPPGQPSNDISIRLNALDAITSILPKSIAELTTFPNQQLVKQPSSVFRSVSDEVTQNLSIPVPNLRATAIALDGGGLRVAWQTIPPGGGSGSIFMQDFSSSGASLSAAIEIDNSGELNVPRLTKLADGNTALIYTKFNRSTARRDSELVIVNPDLVTVHSATINPAGTGLDYIDSRIIATESGGFIHTWTNSNNHPALPANGSFGQRFDSNYQAESPIFSISDTANRVQYTEIIEKSASEVGSLVLDQSQPGHKLSYEIFDTGTSNKQSTLTLSSSAVNSVRTPHLISVGSIPYAAWVELNSGNLLIAKINPDGTGIEDKKVLATGVELIRELEIVERSDGENEILVVADYSDDDAGATAFSIKQDLSHSSHTFDIGGRLLYAGISGSRLNVLSDNGFNSPVERYSAALDLSQESRVAITTIKDLESARALLDQEYSQIASEIQAIATADPNIAPVSAIDPSLAPQAISVFAATQTSANAHVVPLWGQNNYQLGDTVTLAVNSSVDKPVYFSFDVTKVNSFGNDKITGLRLHGSSEDIEQPLSPDQSSWFGESEKILLYTDPLAGEVSIRLTAPNVLTVEGTAKGAGADFSVSLVTAASDGTQIANATTTRGLFAGGYLADVSTLQGAINAERSLAENISTVIQTRATTNDHASLDQILSGLELMKEIASQSKALSVSSAAHSNQFDLTSMPSTAQIDRSLDLVGKERGLIGAVMNRLETVRSLYDGSVIAHKQALSLLRDADYAFESQRLAKSQILQASAAEMISSANGMANEVLAIVRAASF